MVVCFEHCVPVAVEWFDLNHFLALDLVKLLDNLSVYINDSDRLVLLCDQSPAIAESRGIYIVRTHLLGVLGSSVHFPN